MPRRGKGAAGFLPLFGGLCLVLGLGFVVIGGIDHAPAAWLVAADKPAVAEVVWSRDCRDRHGKERRRRTGVAVADSDGTGLTGGVPDAMRHVPGSTADVLLCRGPSCHRHRMVPGDEWARWREARVSRRVGGFLAAMGTAALLMGQLPRAPSRASACLRLLVEH